MTMLNAPPADAVLHELLERLLGDYADRALLTGDEVADLLGQGRSSTFDAIRRGDLPSVRWGRRVYVPTPALARWLMALDADP